MQPRYSRIAVSRPGDRAAGSFHRPKDLHRTVAAATVVAKAACRKCGECIARQRSGNCLGDAFKRWQIFGRHLIKQSRECCPAQREQLVPLLPAVSRQRQTHNASVDGRRSFLGEVSLDETVHEANRTGMRHPR